LEQAQRFLADFKQTTGPYDESYLRVVRLSDSLLATGGTDGVPRIWSIDGSRKLHELSKLHQGEITDMAFHENELMISASQDLVAVFNAKDGQVLHRLQAAEFAGLNRSYRSLIIPVAEELGDVLATVLDKRSRQTFIQVLEPQANYRPSSLGGRKISQAPVSAIMGRYAMSIILYI
jgi:WD40 repeat protein